MASSYRVKRILIVDDNPVILNVLSSALKSGGYEVVTAVDGPEAFSIVGQEKLDLILLDINFPPDIYLTGNTWDAFLILNWLRRMGGPHAKNVPVIVMSGAEPVGIRDRCLAAGAVEYFQKPVKIPELLHTIQEIFYSRAGEVPVELVGTPNSDRPRL
jgi:two-component system, sensor histidine kinase